mmetsp:Transcript_734/g.1134  ORF Transcript_734/g.1134 Transcript_734/m.1134 type:complete len:284 (-) Transcript_734:36-887(-)
MPLITIVGGPCSGKTRTAKEIKAYLEEKQEMNVHVVSDDILFEEQGKSDAYKNGHIEKITRARVQSEAIRFLSKKDIVIVDSLNYIKGFRFELFRRSQILQTPRCTVYQQFDVDCCLEWNKKRAEEDEKAHVWDEKILKDLHSRLEIPNGTKRWDKPLFVVQEKDKPLAFLDDLLNVVVKFEQLERKGEIVKELSDSNFLYAMNEKTNAIIKTILDMKSRTMKGDLVKVHPDSEERFVYPMRVSVPALRKLRFEFIKITSTKPPKDTSTIPSLFIIFLNERLK